MASEHQARATPRSPLTEGHGPLVLAQQKQNCFQKEGSFSRKFLSLTSSGKEPYL